MSAVKARRALDGLGTPEVQWRRWLARNPPPPLEIPHPHRVVAVAPHPDDDVLGAGGLLHQLARAGATIVTVAVTDGEASHPRSPTTTPARLARLRAAESAVAHARLGIEPGGVRLRLPDGGVEARREELTSHIARHLLPRDWCLAPWDGDGHPDHGATGAAARAACDATGAALVSYLVWTWHWATPGSPALPWDRARRVELGRGDRAQKRWALRAFRSQTLPLGDGPEDAAILTPAELAHHRRQTEVLLW